MTFAITWADGKSVSANSLIEAREQIDQARGIDQSDALFPAVIHELQDGQDIGTGRFVEQHER